MTAALKRQNHILISLAFVALMFLTACTEQALDIKSQIGNTISGSAKMFSTGTLSTGVGSLSAGCSSGKISLHAITSTGSIDPAEILSSNIGADGIFSLPDAREKGIFFDSTDIKYVLKAEGCGSEYLRPLTEYQDQAITGGSTLLSMTAYVSDSSKTPLTEVRRDDAKNVISQIDLVSAPDLNTLLNQIISNNTLSQGFINIANVPPAKLKELPPSWAVTAPTSASENSSTAYSVNLTPWNLDYLPAYEWSVDGSVVSTSANWTYQTNKNSQGLHTIQLRVGMNAGAGLIDSTKPVKTQTTTTQVSNDYPAMAPAIVLNGSIKRNFLAGSLSMNTGALKINCETLSTLALTENPFVAPLLPSDFTLTCTQAVTQNIPFVLSIGDGPKTLALWARDQSGNVSNLASTVNVLLDQTNPSVSISSVGPLKGGNITNIVYSTSDATSGLQSVILDYAADGVTFTQVADLVSLASPYAWATPTTNVSTAKLRITTTDQASNVSQVITPAFVIDSTPPSALVLTRTSPAVSNSTVVTMTLTGCAGDAVQMLFSQNSTTPAVSDPLWETCSTAKTFTVSAGDGAKVIYAFAKDAVGNISSSANVAFTLDQTNPSLAFTSMNSGGSYAGGSSKNISWTLSDANLTALPLKIEYTTDGVTYTLLTSGVSNSPASYAWTLPLVDSASVRLRLTGVDQAGNTSVVMTTPFIIDSTPPSVDSLSINSGATTTNNNNVQMALSGHDSLSKIQFFCFHYDNASQPLANDSCWKDVTAPSPGILAATAINFSGYYYQFGFTKGATTVYAWVKDAAGQISTNTATLNVDKYTINFNPGTPPIVSSNQVTNVNAPPNPITETELSAPATSNIFIKWNISSTTGFGATPISLQYTTDDVNFTPLPGGTNLANGANGACTVDTGFSGCALLLSPTSGYFKIKTIATDTLGINTYLSSVPLNNGKLKILAGNTDDGLNGSASSAVFYVYGSGKNVNYGYKNKLAVSEDGKFFYIDRLRGLLWIDPTSGVLKKFINVTGTSSGDGGGVASATLNQASAIHLDSHNNLLIWDYNRIRKVDLTTMIITAVLGGGSSADPSGTVDATALQLSGFDQSRGTFIPMPNGDIIFSAPLGSLHYRRYRAVDGKIELMALQGTGFNGFPADSWSGSPAADMGIAFNSTTSAINFMAEGFYKSVVGDATNRYSRIDFAAGNETTPYPGIGPYDLPLSYGSVFTGLDGKLYYIDRFRTVLKRYDPATNAMTLMLGTGAIASVPCAENTAATSCPIDIDSVFITKNSRIYFMDGGTLRTIDDTNKVITLFGQFPSFGNGSLATTARFGSIQDIKMGKSTPVDNKIIVEDSYSNEFREVTINGNLTRLTDAGFTWAGTFRFEADPATGDIFSVNGTMQRFDRITNTWSSVVGGGTSPYYDPLTDGKIGSQVDLTWYNLRLIGFINGKLFYEKHTWNGSAITGCYIKTYDTNDSYRQGHFMGTGPCAWPITSGTLLQNNPVADNISNVEYFQDPVDSVNKYFFATLGTGAIYAGTAAGNVNSYINLTQPINSFTHNTNVDGLNFYYCGWNGFLYKRIYSTATTVQLAWSSPTFRCKASPTIIYNSSRNSIIFPFTQSGLDGVAEYNLSP